MIRNAFYVMLQGTYIRSRDLQLFVPAYLVMEKGLALLYG